MRTPRVTPAGTKRLLAVARVVAPVLLPLLAQAAAAGRDSWERARARRLGVDVDRLPEFTGRGAALHVRLSALATSVHDLRARHPDERPFADDTEQRLADLGAAVRAAEQMPAARRRAAHRAVAADLDAIEADLLARLGV